MKVMEWIKRNKWIMVGAGLGALGGYAYYHFVGCASGTCAITSSPVNSTLYGTLMGGLFVNLFSGLGKPINKKKDE
jgi:phage shock protein E